MIEDPWREIAGLSKALTEAPDVESRLESLLTFCREIWSVEQAFYFPIGRNLTDMADRPAKGQGAFWEYLSRLGQPVVVTGEEVEGLSSNQELPPVVLDGRWRTFLIAPVATATRAVGVLVLAEEVEREFDETDVAKLHAVVPQIAAVLDASLLLEETRYREAYSRALSDIDMMIASYDVGEILRHGVRKITETIAAQKVMVFIVNPETGAVRPSVAEGCPYAREGNLVNEPCAKLAMRALRERRSQIINPQEMAAIPGVRPREGCTETQAVVTPIMANNQMFGVLAVLDKRDGRPFHRNEIGFINQVALKLALVIQNTQAYLTINRLNEGLEQKVRERTSQLEGAITSLQETQAQLMQTEKMATIGTLAGGVAHELNNPLAAILANVQLLRMDIDDPEQVDSLSLIETGAKRCKHIIENLLNYARRSTPDHRSLSVNAILRDTLDMLGHQLRHGNIVVVLELGEVAPVIAIATELGQVFTNLVVNALDALNEDVGRQDAGRLTIATAMEGKSVVVTVIDDGPGIDAHVISKIFNPFFTTKEVGKGTGLGLSVSQQIAASFGGHIEAASRPGEGTTFRVVLPAAQAVEGRPTREL